MIHEKHGMLVYVDGHPSDTLGNRPDESPTVAGVVSDQDRPIEWLDQYKEARGKRRLKMANRLADAISNEECEINAVCCFTSYREIERFGSEVLDCVPDEVARLKNDKYKFKEFDLARDTAVYAAWYATAIIFIGQRAAEWAHSMEVKRVQLICDHFPGDTAQVMHTIMAASLLCQNLRQCWDESKEKYEVEFGVANLAEVSTPDGEKFSHQNYVELQVADWIAHAHYAYTNTDQYWDGDTPRDEDYRKAIELPWTAPASKHRTRSIELGPRMTADLEAAIKRGPFQRVKYAE